MLTCKLNYFIVLILNNHNHNLRNKRSINNSSQTNDILMDNIHWY